jgi:deoxyribodipyrimidine photo-lyase
MALINFNLKRVLRLNKFNTKISNIIYWMSRDQRFEDNHSLEFASLLAKQNKAKLAIVFALDLDFASSNIRNLKFMLKGLFELQKKAKEINLSFYIFNGNPVQVFQELFNKNSITTLVTDFSPLKIKNLWLKEILEIAKLKEIDIYQVDSHNIVPVWQASKKEEYAARTIRNKINSKLDEFLTDYNPLQEIVYKLEKLDLKSSIKQIYETDLDKILVKIKNQDPVNFLLKYRIKDIKPGVSEANLKLQDFLHNRLPIYHDLRNDPNQEAQSGLSPYLHFGQISSQRVAFEVKKYDLKQEAKEAFLEELIVRKELSDNFCFYNQNYDNSDGFKDWAKTTLNEHLKDVREYIYSKEEFENAKTHDPLWNGCQIEMIQTGKMHGFMRMYWAKKILEWTADYNQAMKIAIYLNDKYQLDGRDPNGYVGIAWSIGGIHDRAWFERKVFGKIRYMNFNGCKRKFDVEKYINKFKQL